MQKKNWNEENVKKDSNNMARRNGRRQKYSPSVRLGDQGNNIVFLFMGNLTFRYLHCATYCRYYPARQCFSRRVRAEAEAMLLDR